MCVKIMSIFLCSTHEFTLVSSRKRHFDVGKFEDERQLGADEKTELLLKKWDDRMWIGFIWPRI